MIIMSLRDGGFPSKQSPISQGDCFATCTRNDMQTARLASHKGVILLFQTQEELRPFFGRTLMPSILDKAFKEDL